MRENTVPPIVPPRILFVTGSDWFSYSVRSWTNSVASHVAINCGPGNAFVLHAMGKGVMLEPRKNLYLKYIYRDIAEFEILPDVTEGYKNALAQVGKPYDKGEITSRVVNGVLRLACPWIPKVVTTPGHWTCARFVLLLDPSGKKIPEWGGLNPYTVTPEELLQTCLKSSSFRRVESPLRHPAAVR